MCCLFGIVDYGGRLTARQKNHLVAVLSIAAEERGTDAVGIAYNASYGLTIDKRPVAAHRAHFHIPPKAKIVMGHTRLATQGDAKQNRNNHPFAGKAGKERFALAHNGVLYNDKILRNRLRLPLAKIETDSYVAVQLLEKAGELSWQSLQRMAEEVEGSFTFTVLSAKDKLYFIKGDSPLTILHFPEAGAYLYASTAQILRSALRGCENLLGREVEIPVSCGDLLSIDHDGTIERETFDDRSLVPYAQDRIYCPVYTDEQYVQLLKSVASCFGYAPEEVDRLLAYGFSPEEIEDYFYGCEEDAYVCVR